MPEHWDHQHRASHLSRAADEIRVKVQELLALLTDEITGPSRKRILDWAAGIEESVRKTEADFRDALEAN